jgi:hypothetical protein
MRARQGRRALHARIGKVGVGAGVPLRVVVRGQQHKASPVAASVVASLYVLLLCRCDWRAAICE